MLSLKRKEIVKLALANIDLKLYDIQDCCRSKFLITESIGLKCDFVYMVPPIKSGRLLQYFNIPLCPIHANSLPVFYQFCRLFHPDNCR